MKLKILLILVSTLIFSSNVLAIDGNEVTTFSDNNMFGIKKISDNSVIVTPQYKKLIRLGNSSWITQNSKNKFGLIDNNGKILVPFNYIHADRLVSKFVKFGNYSDYGVYDETGKTIVQPIYKKVEILYGHMFLTYKDYKYGVVSYDGNVILENKFENIYMPKPNVMVLQYNGVQYELEQVNADTLSLPENGKDALAADDDSMFKDIMVKTGAISGYSVLSLSDYIVRIFSSISPAHEDTIDELILSQGADTVDIIKKFTWIPKYPIVYCRKYYENVANYNSGVFYSVRAKLKSKI